MPDPSGGHIPVWVIMAVVVGAFVAKQLLFPMLRQHGTLPTTSSGSPAGDPASPSTSGPAEDGGAAADPADTLDPLAFTIQGSPLEELGIIDPSPGPPGP